MSSFFRVRERFVIASLGAILVITGRLLNDSAKWRSTNQQSKQQLVSMTYIENGKGARVLAVLAVLSRYFGVRAGTGRLAL